MQIILGPWCTTCGSQPAIIIIGLKLRLSIKEALSMSPLPCRRQAARQDGSYRSTSTGHPSQAALMLMRDMSVSI